MEPIPFMAVRRKLRMGMIGGGEGAFIGGVHRIAAALDQQVDLVAGVFSRDWANTSATGAARPSSTSMTRIARPEASAGSRRVGRLEAFAIK